MMLQIGIKYCGGCQEYYDRIAGAKYIQAACRDTAVFSPARENTTYDLILVICGCTVLCPDYLHYASTHGVLIVCGPEDFETAIQKIKSLHAGGFL